MKSPTVEWQVCGICNYDCTYCIQSPKTRQGHPSAEEVEQFLAFFASLDHAWEVKMTGGEPFAFPAFLERIVPGLIEATPHKVSVLTNLSASPAQLRRFAELTRGRLNIVSASVHLEHVEIDAFVEKARTFRAQLDENASMVINAVLVPGRLDQVEHARTAIEGAGLRFFPQVMKIGGGTFAYDDDDRGSVQRLVGISPNPRRANVAPSYRGRICHTGVDYFVLTQRGDGWRCRTSRRFDEGFLGNVLAGTFALARSPSPCTYDICPCTVPANRGMIEGVA